MQKQNESVNGASAKNLFGDKKNSIFLEFKSKELRDQADNLKNRYFDYLIYIGLFFLLCMLFAFVPLTSDDLIFKGTTGRNLSEILSYAFNYGNGRFLGNFSLSVCVHFNMFKILFKSAIILFISYSISKLFNFEKYYMTCINVMIIMFLSSGFLSQCFTWTAGFCNYVVPVSLLMSCLLLLKYYSSKQNKIIRFLMLFLLSICGISVQLFSENTSITVVALSIILIITNAIQHKKLEFSLFTFFASSVVGGIIMMVIPVLANAQDKLTDYRNIATIRTLYIYVLHNISRISNIMNSAALLWFLLSTVLLIHIFRTLKISFARNKIIRSLILIIYPFVCLVFNLLTDKIYDTHNLVITFFSIFLFFAYVINTISIIWKLSKKQDLTYSIAFLVTAILSVAPLMIINLAGHRTYFITIFILYLMILSTIKTSNFNVSGIDKDLLNVLKISPVIVCACVIILSTGLMMDNFVLDKVRGEYILEKMSDNVQYIEVPRLPFQNIVYEQYLPAYEKYYYYKTPGDVTLNFVDIEGWDGFKTYKNKRADAVTLCLDDIVS